MASLPFLESGPNDLRSQQETCCAMSAFLLAHREQPETAHITHKIPLKQKILPSPKNALNMIGTNDWIQHEHCKIWIDGACIAIVPIQCTLYRTVSSALPVL